MHHYALMFMYYCEYINCHSIAELTPDCCSNYWRCHIGVRSGILSPCHSVTSRQLETVYHHVCTQLATQQSWHETLYDCKAAGHSYSVGNHVWLHCPVVTQGRKFLQIALTMPRTLWTSESDSWCTMPNLAGRTLMVLYCCPQLKYQRQCNRQHIKSPTPNTIQPSNVQPSPARQSDYDDEPLVILWSLPVTQPANEPPLRWLSQQ